MDNGLHFSYIERDTATNAIVTGFMSHKIVADYAARTGRRRRSAAKKLLGIGATKKRTASLKVVR